MKNKIIAKLKSEIVTVISFLLAVISMIFVKPDSSYFEYIDFRTLIILFCLMLVVSGIRQMNIFYILGEKLVKRVSNMRVISFILISLCFFSSMFITNDVALITFVPFTIEILYMIEKRQYLILIIILETIAANMGSSMTPIGNPQNIYLYSLADINILDFIKLILPYTFITFLLLTVINFIAVKNENVEISINESKENQIKIHKLMVYLLLFIISLLTVGKIINYYILLLIVLIVTLIFDRKNIKNADYFLLLTFAFLFIFIGNMSRIEVINNFIKNILVGKEVLVGILSSQIISNVPAAILLSKFSNNYKALLLGVNIGGLGTLIASMASLISYKFYAKTEGCNVGKYVCKFTIYNVLFLVILFIEYIILGNI